MSPWRDSSTGRSGVRRQQGVVWFELKYNGELGLKLPWCGAVGARRSGNLTRFVELAGQYNLFVNLRIGPYGEPSSGAPAAAPVLDNVKSAFLCFVGERTVASVLRIGIVPGVVTQIVWPVSVVPCVCGGSVCRVGLRWHSGVAGTKRRCRLQVLQPRVAELHAGVV